MTARPTWQGHLRLSLVSCPVALYTATSRTGDVSFNMLHKTTHNRIRMVPTDPEIGPVERSDIVKGYEIEKDRYVVVTPEEIDKIALGRLVMHQRERMLALEPRGKGLVAYTLRTFDEVKAPEDFFEDIPAAKADKNMIAIAAKIIEQQEGDFDPREFKDNYEDALRALIKEKENGAGREVTVEEPQGAEVIDLMEALRLSLAGGKGAAKTSAKKAAAKHPPAKKRA
ncbi:MAG: Ku protein [Pseudomonadota bacterium]